MIAFLSSLAVSTRRPSGLNEAATIAPVCPARTCTREWSETRHTRALPSAPALTTSFPSPLNDTTVTGEPLRTVQTVEPLPARQRCTAPSAPPVTTRSPRRLNDPVVTGVPCREGARTCPANSGRSVGACGQDAVAVLAERHARDLALVLEHLCRRWSRIRHTRAVPSSLALIARVPSGLKEAVKTGPLWRPSRRSCSVPSQTRAVPSSLAVTTRLPVDE